MVGANAEETDYIYLYGGAQWTLRPELSGTESGKPRRARFGLKHNDRASAGYFGRINYDYKGIYLLELNGRYDGSSCFPSNDRWAFFPSASIGYRLSEEAYFQPLKNIINNAKLRASFWRNR